MNRQFFCLFVSFFAYWRNCITFSSLFLNSASNGLIFGDAQKRCVQVKRSVVTPDSEQSCLALYSAICHPTPLLYMRWTMDSSGQTCTSIILRPCCVPRWVWSDSLPALVEQQMWMTQLHVVWVTQLCVMWVTQWLVVWVTQWHVSDTVTCCVSDRVNLSLCGQRFFEPFVSKEMTEAARLAAVETVQKQVSFFFLHSCVCVCVF